MPFAVDLGANPFQSLKYREWHFPGEQIAIEVQLFPPAGACLQITESEQSLGLKVLDAEDLQFLSSFVGAMAKDMPDSIGEIRIARDGWICTLEIGLGAEMYTYEWDHPGENYPQIFPLLCFLFKGHHWPHGPLPLDFKGIEERATNRERRQAKRR